MSHHQAQQNSHKASMKRMKGRGKPTGDEESTDDDHDVSLTEKRMKEVVRSQGRLTKKGGVLMSSGAGEFQIASSSALERLVQSVDSP